MKTAIITGGAGGMGLATARLMGTDHRLVIADVHQDRVDAAARELRSLGFAVEAVVADVTDRASVNRLFERAEADGSRVRAVIHTAGVSPQMGAPSLIARVNALGTVNIGQAFVGRAQEGDVLVNVASVAGHGLPRALVPIRAFPLAETNPRQFERAVVRRARVLGKKLHPGLTYAISKAFVIWYSRQQAHAFGAAGARVVSVSPGSFDTAMGRLEKNHGAADLLKLSAIPRFGKPDEIAAVLAFAASAAPGYLTGTDILVDGGTRAGQEFGRSR